MAASLKKIDMPYVRLGKSGLKVSKIILGCMSYGSKDWQAWVLEEEEAIKHIKFAWDAGINTFDTACNYSNGISEIILGKALKQLNVPRASYVVMTKVFGAHFSPTEPQIKFWAEPNLNPDSVGLVNRHGLSRKNIFDSVKASLERLGLEYIDVLQCHRFDSNTPVEETMRALHDLVTMGLVRYIGMSSCWAWQFHKMQNYALSHNLTPFISMQNHYSLAYREEEREMHPTCELFGVGTIPWSPLAQGLLCRPNPKSAEEPNNATTRDGTDLSINTMRKGVARAIIDRVEELAKKKGVTMAQISTAWVLHKDVVAAPIIGTTKIEQLQDLIAAVHVQLTKEEMEYLEEPYVARGIIGHA